MARDYYEILGVGKGAVETDIKRAYRKLAMEWHPDKHKGDKTAEEKFKEINNAYETLSDPQKKAQYDQFGEAGANFGGSGGGFGGGGAGGFDFGGFQGNFEGQGFADVFEAFFNGFGGRSNAPRKGRNLEFELKIGFEEAAFGCEKELMITRPAGRSGEKASESIKVKAPAGVDNDSVIRVSGKGEPGQNGGPAGDLYVHIRIAPHKEFVRNNFDVHSHTEISSLLAILGGEIRVRTLQGEVTVKIPAGTQPGKVFKLKSYGIKKLHSEEKGDHFVKISVAIPTKLSKKERTLYQELAEEAGMDMSKAKGFWK